MTDARQHMHSPVCKDKCRHFLPVPPGKNVERKLKIQKGLKKPDGFASMTLHSGIAQR